jgi:outer membrane protein OmpA-like peptidoglycan-associated protein
LKIEDPKAQSTVYFGYYKGGSGTDSIINMRLRYVFVISGDKVIFRSGNSDAKYVTVGMLLTFINTNMSPSDTDLLDAKDTYVADCENIFGGETSTGYSTFANTMKIQVGGKVLTVTNDERPLEKGGKGVTLPLFAGDKIIGSCEFDFAKSTLREESKEILSSPALWDILTKANAEIQIVGHTDGKGSKEVNRKLSEDRAKSVLNFLQTLPEFKNIKPNVKISSIGKGYDEPAEPDDKGKNALAAARNRRVVILIDGKGPNYEELYM